MSLAGPPGLVRRRLWRADVARRGDSGATEPNRGKRLIPRFHACCGGLGNTIGCHHTLRVHIVMFELVGFGVSERHGTMAEPEE